MARWSKVWGAALALALLLLLFGGTRAWLHRAAREAVYPLENATLWCRRHVLARAAAAFHAGGLAARNRELEAEVAQLRLDSALLAALASENRELQQPFGAPARARGRIEPCLVLSRGGSLGWWRQVRLNKGRAHGLAVGDPVLAPDGLVGRISDVTATTADVRLITDPNSRIACELSPADAETGVVRGLLYGGGWSGRDADVPTLLYVIEPLRLRYLERDIMPAPRTRVVTSGLGGTLPPGLLVGYLLDSAVDANGLYRQAEVLPAADFAALAHLFVLVGAGEVAP